MFLLLATEAAEGGEAEVVNPILPTTPELVWGIIAFALLFLLVSFVFLPAAKRVMNDRAASIRADLDAADAARSQAAHASAEVDDQLASARAEAAQILDQARTEGEAERERLISRAEREVTAMREIAESEVRRERDEAMAAVRPQVADLALSAASRVLDRPVDAAAAAPIVGRFLNNSN
ncbi:MAG: F0F1 ATP synthase subunit B [Acidimicrobiales bacterium]